MSFLTSFFTAFFHVLALAWATIHPDVNPNRHSFTTIAHSVRLDAHRKVYASTRAADTGYWHTSGNLILDRNNQPVRIQGINWYGLETVRKAPGGLAVKDFRAILDTIRTQGFNTVRIPFSSDMVENPIVPEAIAFTDDQGREINRALRGLNSLQILDRIVEYAGQIGLKVILDNHRSEAGDSAQGSGLWYTADYPEAAWIADWQMLTRRYAASSTVIGMDLRNEPHNANTGGSCWSGCGAAHDWHLAAARAGNAILARNPHLLVFVEGVDAIGNDYYWWGGNLQGVRTAPVHLNIANQLVYSAHEYGPKEYAQKWFNGASRASLINVFERHWGFVSRDQIAPVWIGEFGTSNRTEDIASADSGSEGQWFQSLTTYFGLNREIHWTSWAFNGEDSDGLMASDYNAPANPLKLAALNRIMTAPAAAPVPTMQVAQNDEAPAVYTAPAVTPTDLAVPSAARSLRTRIVTAAQAPQYTATAQQIEPYRPHLPASVLNGQARLPRTAASSEADGY